MLYGGSKLIWYVSWQMFVIEVVDPCWKQHESAGSVSEVLRSH